MSRPKSSKSIAAKIERDFKENLQLIEDSMVGLPKGSKGYLDRLAARAKLQREYLQQRAERGIDAVNLGIATKPKFSFTATIDMSSAPPDPERQKFEAELDDEFPSSTPPLPALAPKPKKSKRGKQQ